MNSERRGFLKMLAAIPAASLLPSLLGERRFDFRVTAQAAIDGFEEGFRLHSHPATHAHHDTPHTDCYECVVDALEEAKKGNLEPCVVLSNATSETDGVLTGVLVTDEQFARTDRFWRQVAQMKTVIARIP